MLGSRTTDSRPEDGGNAVKQDIRRSLICMAVLSVATLASAWAAIADGPSPTPSSPPPKLSPGLARRIWEITDAVLEHHIDPPARQQMILSGIRALDQAAGVPIPFGMGRRVSALATPEQLAAFLADAWPKSPGNRVTNKQLEAALLNGLLHGVPGGADLVS